MRRTIETGKITLPHYKPTRKFGRVTWNGRLVVDVNQLYRAKKTQKSLAELDVKIGEKVGPISTPFGDAESGTPVPRRYE